MKKKILIAEDDPEVREVLILYLEDAGYRALPAADGEEGLRIAREESPDAAVIDIMIPIMNGFELIQELRTFSDIPIMILSARAFEEDRIRGLSLGADVYMDKPFRPREVIAYMDAMLRRRESAESRDQDFLSSGPFTLDPGRKELVYREDQRIALTAAEFTALEILMRWQGKIFSKKQLYDQMFHEKTETDMNSVPVHISNLRGKLRESGIQEELIETVWGLGYRVEKKQDK